MIKLGIIGCGGMGGHHARTIHSMDGATLVGVADTIAAKATELATELGIEAYTDFHDLLPAVDGVMICTPPFARTEVVVDCAAAGKAIFAEKPIALDLPAADRMLAACDQAGVFMMTGYVLRFTHPFLALRDTFASGELGRLVNCWSRRLMPFDTSHSWYGDQTKSGGVALDFASHDIDWVRWIGGEVRSVFGRVDRVRPGIRADEHVHALFTFDEGFGAIDDSWAPGIGLSSIGLIGSEGAMIIDADGTIRKQLSGAEETIVTPEPGESIQAHFVRCIRDGSEPRVSGHDARQVLAAVLAIQESSRTGQAIVFNEGVDTS